MGAVFLTFLATPRKARFLVITLAGAAGTILILLLNGVSITGMLDSYRAAAIERGGLSRFGFRGYGTWALLRIAARFAVLCLPFLLCIRPFANALRRMDIRHISSYLLLALAPLVSVLAMFNNGELKDVEWALPLAGGAVLVFRRYRRDEISAPTRSPVPFRRFYIAFLCMLVASDLYMGAVRIRVLGIGIHGFFEYQNANQRIDRAFFKDLRASGSFRAVVDQIGRAVSANPGPVFLGPRLEFAYAAFGIPSPRDLPLYWQPGTSFARSQEPAMLEEWSKRRFPTLIFLSPLVCVSNNNDCKGDDFTYYSPPFLDMIHSRYWRDSRYSDVTVYHLRGDAR